MLQLRGELSLMYALFHYFSANTLLSSVLEHTLHMCFYSNVTSKNEIRNSSVKRVLHIFNRNEKYEMSSVCKTITLL